MDVEEESWARCPEYENDICDLNHSADRAEDKSQAEESEDEPSGKERGQNGSDETETKTLPSRGKVLSRNTSSPTVSGPPANDTIGMFNGCDEGDDDPSISDDERDLIYSQLYHSRTVQPTLIAPTVPQNTSNSLHKTKTKKKRTNVGDQPADLSSTKFTFELDLDNIPPPPAPVEPPPQVLNIDSDSDDDVAWHTRGRYFAPQDFVRDTPQQPLCFRCKQRGHILKDCPHILCRTCGAIDAHHEMQCPFRHTCTNCGQQGHQAHKCPIKHSEDPSKPCSMCGGWGHVSAVCHQIWRYYQPAHPDTAKQESELQRWCYNCGVQGHLGDDCRKPRPLHVQGGRVGPIVSAFGEANVPEWAVRQRQQSKKRKMKVDEDEDDEDWFRNREKHIDKSGPPPASKIGSVKLNSSDQRSKQRPPREVLANAAEVKNSVKERSRSSIKRSGSRDLSPHRFSTSLKDRITTAPPERLRRNRDEGRSQTRSYVSQHDSYRPQKRDSYRPDRDSYVPRYRDRDSFYDRTEDSQIWIAKMHEWKKNRDLDVSR